MVNFFLNSDLVVWHLEDGRFVDLNDVVSVPQSSVVRYGVERHLIKKKKLYKAFFANLIESFLGWISNRFCFIFIRKFVFLMYLKIERW